MAAMRRIVHSRSVRASQRETEDRRVERGDQEEREEKSGEGREEVRKRGYTCLEQLCLR